MSGEMLARLTIEVQDATTSPISYNELENPSGSVSIGANNPLVDVTNFTDSSRRYIAGLADGKEFTLECFRSHSSPSIQDQMIAAAENKTNQVLRITVTDYAVSPNTSKTYLFTAVPIDWEEQSSGVGEPQKLLLAYKISGTITRS